MKPGSFHSLLGSSLLRNVKKWKIVSNFCGFLKIYELYLVLEGLQEGRWQFSWHPVHWRTRFVCHGCQSPNPWSPRRLQSGTKLTQTQKVVATLHEQLDWTLYPSWHWGKKNTLIYTFNSIGMANETIVEHHFLTLPFGAWLFQGGKKWTYLIWHWSK